MSDESRLAALARAVARALQARRLKLVAAESCTGGWLAKTLTDLAGSSEWFERGFVVYSNDAKVESIGVDVEVLNAHGAVSEETAQAMAEGALRRSHAQVAVAITGIAGPGGGTADKPIGTVWIAWHQQGARTAATHYVFKGDRESVRAQSVAAALEGVLSIVER
jgi:nicotinamide-nucleotide amidase